MNAEIEKFSQILKSNDIQNIISFIVTKNEFLRHHNKVDIVISNLCSISISNIEKIIKTMKLKATDGSRIALYVKSIECKPHIFGFIHAYYAVSKQLRFSAYGYAAKLGRIDILRKIRDIDQTHFKQMSDYITESPKFTKEVKDFVKQDFKKAKSKKDRSPEDLLKFKLKTEVKRKFTEYANKRKAIYIKKRSSSMKKT